MTQAFKEFETVEVAALEVTCAGSGGTLGHPKVYLHIDQDKGSVTCPYCSRKFVLKHPGGVVAAH